MVLLCIGKLMHELSIRVSEYPCHNICTYHKSNYHMNRYYHYIIWVDDSRTTSTQVV